MDYNIIVTSVAKQHLQDSFEWYELQQFDLGKDFRQEFLAVMGNLLTGMVDYQVYHGDIRKTVLRRFPFYVYYIRNENTKEIIILAVLHHKRNPQYIKSLLL